MGGETEKEAGYGMRTIKPITRREAPQSELFRLLRQGKAGGSPVSLQHLIVRRFDFSGFELRRAEFYNLVLERCSFRGSDLAEVMFGELRAAATDFRGARCRDADIVWSVLRGSRFDRSAFHRAYFFKCDLSLAVFTQADLKGSSFVQCDLSHADFTDARLEAVEFTGCRIHGAKGLQERHLAFDPALYTQHNW